MAYAKSLHSARSRAPIDAVAIQWWDTYGDNGNTPQNYSTGTATKTKTEDKSTSTDTLYLQRQLVNEVLKNTKKQEEPKDKVLKKWKEEQPRKRYERARNAVIKSLKDKFMDTSMHRNVTLYTNENKTKIAEAKPTPVITGDNVKETSNLNGSHEGNKQTNMASITSASDVKIDSMVIEDVSHAMKLQMGPGGELAQWKLAPRGSRAAGAEGGLRGLTRDEMPIK